MLESAFEDFAQPPPAYAAKALAAGRNESWREQPLAAYVRRLHALLDEWRRCAAIARRGHGGAARAWRGIIQLAAFPRARGLHTEPRASDCSVGGQRGMASEPHHIAEINAIAKKTVEGAGFEVFDPSAATLHANPKWFDAVKGQLEYDERKIEPVSDLTTQMLINHICGAETLARRRQS